MAVTPDMGMKRREPWEVQALWEALPPHRGPEMSTPVLIPQVRGWRLRAASRGMVKAQPHSVRPSPAHPSLHLPLGPGHWRAWHHPGDGAEMRDP